MKVAKEGDNLIIEFNYDPDIIQHVKTLANRRWHPTRKVWIAQDCYENIRTLQKLGFLMPGESLEELPEYKPQRPKVVPMQPRRLRKDLMGFQKEGAALLKYFDGRVLLADEQGLGKTPQSLCAPLIWPKERPVVIACPATAKWNWYKEIGKFLGKRAQRRTQVIEGYYHPKAEPLWGEYIIVNYEVLFREPPPNVQKDEKKLKRWKYLRPDIAKLKPQIVITDECHYYKNDKALRTKAVKELAKAARRFIPLSGTPSENKPIEIFNAINFVNPKLFPSFYKFAHRYCNPKHNGFGWDFSGASNIAELHELLVQNVMIRRLKKDVLKELPDKTRTVVPLDMTGPMERKYRKAEDDFLRWLATIDPVKADKAAQAEAITKINYLKQLAAAGKMKMALQWVDDFLESNDKLVIFAHHKTTVNLIMEHCQKRGYKPVKIDGSVPTKGGRRIAIQDKFQSDKSIRVLVGTSAAKENLTLTAASNTAFFELWWKPGAHDQAEDRVHRIGQKDAVFAHYLIARDTVEEQLADLLDAKREILTAMMDGISVEKEALLTALLTEWKEAA